MHAPGADPVRLAHLSDIHVTAPVRTWHSTDWFNKLNSGQPIIVLRNGQIMEGRLSDIHGAGSSQLTVDTPSGQRELNARYQAWGIDRHVPEDGSYGPTTRHAAQRPDDGVDGF